MSRCFPFPPPGYERKIKAGDPCLLKKDKHGEKDHKKERKDKEKIESKEKHGKERTDEKCREKKDKKEKHRDRKEKERDLYKDKRKRDGSCPDERRAAVPPDIYLNKFCEKSNDRRNDGSVASSEKRVAVLSAFNKGVPVGGNNRLASQTKIFNNSVGAVRNNTNEERRINDQLPDKNISSDRQKNGVVKFTPGTIPLLEKPNEQPSVVQKMDRLGVIGEVKCSGNVLEQNVRPVKLPGNSEGPLVDGRERKEKRPINGRMDGRTVSGEVRTNGGRTVAGDVRSSGGPLLPNIVGMAQNKFGTTVSEEEGYNKKEEKRREEIREKPIQREKDEEKKKKKEEKVNATIEQKKHVQMPGKRDGNGNHMLIPGAKNENKKDLSVTLSDGLPTIPKPSSQGDGTLGKRKDIGLNGIYDEQMTGLNKLARTTTPTYPLTGNGRSLEPCQNSAASARPPLNIKVERTSAPDETQRPLMNMEADGKDHKINDVKTVPITQSSRTSSKVERKSQVSAKPPHPDTKYLSQVLTVPILDEWPEWDDQEWLFSSNHSQTKRPQSENLRVEEPTVWASALLLEPVDVFALPYVIPL